MLYTYVSKQVSKNAIERNNSLLVFYLDSKRITL